MITIGNAFVDDNRILVSSKDIDLFDFQPIVGQGVDHIPRINHVSRQYISLINGLAFDFDRHEHSRPEPDAAFGGCRVGIMIHLDHDR